MKISLLKLVLSILPTLLLAIAPATLFAQASISPTEDANTESGGVSLAPRVECMTGDEYNALSSNLNQIIFGEQNYEKAEAMLQTIIDNIDCVENQSIKATFYLQRATATYKLGNMPAEAQALTTAAQICRTNDLRCFDLIYLMDDVRKDLETIINNTICKPEKYLTKVELEMHPYWLNFVPFGAPEFGFHQNLAGGIYAATQSSGIIMSIIGGALVTRYLNDCSGCKKNEVLAKNYSSAKHAQNVLISGVTILTASYVASVIHALIIYEPKTMRDSSSTKLADDELISMGVSPVMLDHGAGFSFSTRF